MIKMISSPDVIVMLHPGTTRLDALEKIRRVLKSAPDWDGGRTHRKPQTGKIFFFSFYLVHMYN